MIVRWFFPVCQYMHNSELFRNLHSASTHLLWPTDRWLPSLRLFIFIWNHPMIFVSARHARDSGSILDRTTIEISWICEERLRNSSFFNCVVNHGLLSVKNRTEKLNWEIEFIMCGFTTRIDTEFILSHTKKSPETLNFGPRENPEGLNGESRGYSGLTQYLFSLSEG